MINNKVSIAGSNHILNDTIKQIGHLDDSKKITTTWIVNVNNNINILNDVKDFCITNNLKIKKESSIDNLTHLGISGIVKDYENALNVVINEYENGGHTYFATPDLIQIPTGWSEYVNILGLDVHKVAHPYFKKMDKSIIKTRAITVFNPLQLATLYNFPTNLNGSGQKIGIIQLGGGYVMSDITTYFSQLNINVTPNITAVSVDGGTNDPTDSSGASVEVVLDVEVIASLVPNAIIRVYFAPNSFQGFYDAIASAINDNCNIISISWGAPEANWSSNALSSYNNLFQTASTKNITILAASGDNGSSDGLSGNNVDFPSSSPWVLACGGTTLQTINNTSISSETTWTGSGGGASKTFARPSYQNNLPSNVLTMLNGKRGSPDICGDADPNTGYVLYSASEGGNFVVGGTSAVSPLWSGLLGRINQSVGTSVGFIHPFLYSTQGIYNDILVGNNGAFTATQLWDACTGWGSPNGQQILNALTTNTNPTANFSASPLSGNGPLNVTFTNASTLATSYLWNFGDNTTSTNQNPAHTFSNVGTYTITLTATNNSGSNVMTKQSYITVTNIQAPVSSFNATPLSGSTPLTVKFTNTSTNNPTSWLWNFGDNTTSTVKNPSHIYQNAGSYTVTLTVTNNANSNTLTKSNYITVSPKLTSNFSANKTSGNAPTNITFTDLSTGNPVGWLWNFGDNTSSTQQNPIHTYTRKGLFNVSLRVTGSGGINTMTKVKYIKITTNPPTASFTRTPTSGSKPLTVQFTDISINNPNRWSWNFGDNTTSTLQNPSHIYSRTGVYSVKLIASNAYGTSSVTKIRYVTVI